MQLKAIGLWLLSFILLGINSSIAHSDYPATDDTDYKIQYPEQVQQLLLQISPDEMWTNLGILTDPIIFPDRANYHESGLRAAGWIQAELETMIRNSNRDDIELYTVETKGFNWGHETNPFYSKQPSIVLKIGASTEPAILIGAHFDTMGCNEEGCVNEDPLPGADDDGSGTVTVMEVARTLLASDMYFKKPIYLVLYAAEEADLWGSQAVIDSFKEENITVDAVMQLDMTGYAKDNDLTLYLESGDADSDHPWVDLELTYYLQQLITYYIGRPAVLGCGSGGSDHEAWYTFTEAKISRPLEGTHCDGTSRTNPYMHTPEDTTDKLSLTHMTDYLKLAIVFVVELAEPIE